MGKVRIVRGALSCEDSGRPALVVARRRSGKKHREIKGKRTGQGGPEEGFERPRVDRRCREEHWRPAHFVQKSAPRELLLIIFPARHSRLSPPRSLGLRMLASRRRCSKG